MSMFSMIMMFLKKSSGSTPLWAFVVAFVILGGIGAAFMIYAFKKNKKRIAALSKIATEMGWKFTAEAGDQWLHQQGNFPLFSNGHSQSVHYLMRGQIDGAEVALFDLTIRYSRTGKTRAPDTQTVVYIRSGQLNLPSFYLEPENFFHKIASAVGYKDIDFETHPEFSKRYLLRGQDDTAIRSLFNPALLAFFESFKGGTTVAYADRAIYYRDSISVSNEEIRPFLNEAVQVFNQLRGAQTSPQVKSTVA